MQDFFYQHVLTCFLYHFDMKTTISPMFFSRLQVGVMVTSSKLTELPLAFTRVYVPKETWVVVSTIFLFSPRKDYEDFQFDKHIFQLGWFNHQEIMACELLLFILGLLFLMWIIAKMIFIFRLGYLSKKNLQRNHGVFFGLEDTLQGTNISPKNGILKMIFLFPR